MKNLPRCCLVLLALGTGATAPAVILFNAGNLSTVEPPESASLPWDSIGRVTNATGTSLDGTTVHLGQGYMLTAHHVSLGGQYVTFDGTTYFQIDAGFTPVQVAAGVDLKVFRLVAVPAVAAVTLHQDSNSLNQSGYLVGWGLGRDATALGANLVGYGAASTLAKRWGGNTVRAEQTVNYDSYTQTGLVTYAGNAEGDYEAVMATYDSGAPFFQQFGDAWVVTGIGTSVTTIGGAGTVTFGNEPPPPAGLGDRNYYVSVSHYAGDIMAIVPEPRQAALVFGLLLLLVFGRRRPRG